LVADNFQENETNDFQSVRRAIAQATRTPMLFWHGRPLESASRHSAGYDNCRVIMLSRTSADSLDAPSIFIRPVTAKSVNR
jgi:hypothetical protein